jgi:hypothetical protein
MFVFTLSFGMRLGPRVEVITMLACERHLPEPIGTGNFAAPLESLERCKTDPIVQAAVAKVTTGTS